jgi:hypothetical protein
MSITTGVGNGGTALLLNCPTSIANPANTAVSDLYRLTIRGDDGYGAADYWTTGVAVTNASNVECDGLAISGSSSQLGVGVNLVGLPGAATYGVQYNIAKSNLQYLATGVLYGSYVQGLTVDQTNFTFAANGIADAGSESGALVQLSVTNSQFNPGPASNGNGIVTATAIGSLQIANSMFVIGGPSQSAITLSQAKHFAITNNEIQGIGSTLSNGIVIGTTMSSSPGIIAGNDIFGFTGAASGIWLQAASTLVNIYGNVFAANTTNITNAGTNNIIVNNIGYNPVGPASITVGASPFTYTAGSSPETVYVWGGAVSQINIDKNGGALTTIAASQSNCSFDLGPYEQIKVTYSATPNMNKMIH